MGLNGITINKNAAGVGTPPASKDHYSGLLFYNNTLPSGYSEDGVKKIFSLAEAEALGITEGSAAHGVEWYHIREYFEKDPKGELFLGYYGVPAVPATHDFAEITTMQTFADGDLRQIGVFYQHSPFSTAIVGALQTVAAANEASNKPLSIIYGGDISAVADLSTLNDLTALSAPRVSVTIGQDGGGKGKALFDSEGYSITDLGAKLGAVSFARVSDSIAWVEKFPMVTDGTEFDVVAFANGDAYKDLSESLIGSLNDQGYIFARKIDNYAGTFHSDSFTAVATTNDFSTIENNRTMDKAIRGVRSNLIPKIASPLKVTPEGKLSAETIGVFKALASRALEVMEQEDELSAFEVVINEDQDVVSTNTVELTVKIIPIGVAREIVVNIGFTTKLS